MFPLRQNATHKITIGPVVAVGDGFTPVTTLAVSSADDAEVILHNNATVVDISAYTFAAITTADGYYHLTLQTGISSTIGHMTVVINDDSLCLPVKADFMVVEESVYDRIWASAAVGPITAAEVKTQADTALTDYDPPTKAEMDTAHGLLATPTNITAGTIANVTLVATTTDVTNQVTADMTAISGDSAAADNLEAMYDGTGYTDVDAPASRSQVDSIGAASGAALNYEATSDNLTVAIKTVDNVGTPTGTFGNTQAEDGSVVSIAAAADDIDHIFGYNIGGSRTATEVTFAGYLQGANDSMLIQAYDFVGSDWETIAQLSGKAGTANVTLIGSLLLKHTGTGADIGNVYIRFEADGVMSTPVLVIDKLLVGAVNIGRTVGYANGAVYVDTVNGVAGTETYVNGVADSPTNLWASAQTIAAAIGTNGLKHYHINNGSDVTLDAATDNIEITGDEFTLHFGGRSIDNTSVHDGLAMDGTFLGFPHLLHTGVGTSGITGPGAKVGFGAIRGPVVSNASTSIWVLHDCWGTSVANSAFDFGAAVAAAQTVYITSYHGPLNVKNMDHADDKLYLSGNGSLVIAASSTTGNIYLSGQWVITNNGTTTVVYDKLTTDSAATLVDTATTIPATITTLQTDSTLIVADTNELQTDWADGGRLDLLIDAIPTTAMRGTDSAATATSLAALVTTVGVAGLGLSDLGGMSTGMKAEVNTETDTAWTTIMADSVATDGTIATREQALYQVIQMLTEMAVVDTTMTINKVDGTTALMTFTLDDGTDPTTITRAS